MRTLGSLASVAGAVTAALLLAGCSGGTVPSPSLVTMAPLASPTPTAAPATPAPATPSLPSTTPAVTPAPTMDPALVGTWTGEVKDGRSDVPTMATYTIVPCAVVGDKCGTWEWRAVASTCRGQLRYEGQQDGVLYVLATVGSGSDPTCGPDMESLRLEATDTLHINLHGTGGSAGVGAVAKWGSGTLQRVIDSAAPTASQ